MVGGYYSCVWDILLLVSVNVYLCVGVGVWSDGVETTSTEAMLKGQVCICLRSVEMETTSTGCYSIGVLF